MLCTNPTIYRRQLAEKPTTSPRPPCAVLRHVRLLKAFLLTSWVHRATAQPASGAVVTRAPKLLAGINQPGSNSAASLGRVPLSLEYRR
jgi:hypothetical protein